MEHQGKVIYMEHQGFKVITYDKDGNEVVLIDIKPDEGGRGTVEHGICKSLTFLAQIEQVRQRYGEGETLGMVSELGKYAIAWLYALAINGMAEDSQAEVTDENVKED